MKVGQTNPIGPVSGISARTENRRPAPREVRKADDVATVMGIPETELTPHVRAAIMTLMDEVSRLREDLRQAKSRVDHLEELADRDTLVPLINRRAFVREISRMISYAERYGTTHSIIYFDLNGMKAINDAYGHAAGDAVLMRVAEILADSTRESDIVGRLGGDEFGLLMVQSSEAKAREKAGALAVRIGKETIEWQGKSLPISVAWGAHAIKPGQDIHEALAAADRAMYVNKGARERG